MLRLFLIFIIMVLITNCKKDTASTGGDNGPDTTSHTYEWIVDTLQGYPDAMQVLIKDIWGTDEDNVWAIGHSDAVPYQIWHWNGEKWTNINPWIPGDSPSYKSIFGFSEHDFWIVGAGAYRNDPGTQLHYRDYILKYNTGQWQRIQEIESLPCYSVWGTSSNNLFIGCDSGIILHKDQTGWTRQQTPHKYQITRISGINEDEIFAVGITNPVYVLYKYHEKTWITVDSVMMSSPRAQWHFGHVIWGLENEQMYSAGENGVYSYENGKWDKLLGGHPFRSIYGSASNNLFAAALFQQVYHYNGNTWKRDDFFDDYYFGAVGNIWCNENVVYLAAREAGIRSYIFRGKKK